MIDSIDTNAAAPAGDADFSSAAPLEAESPAGSIPATPHSSGLLGEDGSFVPEWYSRFEELKGTENPWPNSRLRKPWPGATRNWNACGVIRGWIMKNKWRVSAKWPACLTPKKTTAWNVRKPCRKRNGTLNWRNAWPAPPTATVFLRKP